MKVTVIPIVLVLLEQSPIFSKGIERPRNNRASGDHADNSFIKIDQNNE